ncbi:hypothetical protein Sp245p_22895 (plasmid) [Azospirillum baldaniorum]|uniref:Uncharacterized protein n=1 Tax=Azospirillum baldaniorum TaxID=1064539 RepID=A0A9P1NRD5_9PROT|nr:hypothetical protein [Azospirillum baldaniorum]AWJ92699.1 hypothetical protein Sp245p_22895 [Azospirillum baldaniorum]TWA78111.1 hypothetical protein FBZ85_106271 [Azospirillum brasilense]CCD02778.1 conserved protein of unknown function [Azospirillum baldaniorum]
MLVYGDRDRLENPCVAVARIAAAHRTAAAKPDGLIRHAMLVSLFIEAAELAQGLADAEFAALGEDDCTPCRDAAMAVVMGLARAVARSWRGEPQPGACALAADLETLSAQPLPETVRIRRSEGYAFYGLYPEAYLEAAARLPPDLPAPLVVIGLRSIGTGLAAMAAVALDAAPPVTLRPIGHPFQRAVRLSARLRAALLADAGASYVIVDEGPGLSGSSFGAVADWLEAAGVPSRRIAFLPSHKGDPGPRSSDRHRRRWAEAVRPVIDFNELVHAAHGPVPPLERWFEDTLGPAVAPLRDLSGGAWRTASAELAANVAADWLPVHAQQERRKFLLRTASGSWLLKFAGLGRLGEAKLDRARALHQAGFTTKPMALRHGFLAERWLDGAQLPSTMPLERLADYLLFRAQRFPAERDTGASLPDLLAMAHVNIGEALGAAATVPLDRWTRDILSELDAGVRRVVTDNRLHIWEWLRTTDGRVLKTDSLDHADAHDLIGCQDIAWDVAGAIVEFGLAEAEADRLCDAVGASKRLVAFHLPCYLAFQIGCWSFASSDAGAASMRRFYEEAWKRQASRGGRFPPPAGTS